MKASDRYQLKILPAGKNDRVAEISTREGDVLKYIYCPHQLSGNSGGLDEMIRADHESLEAEAFAKKYELPSPGSSGDGGSKAEGGSDE